MIIIMGALAFFVWNKFFPRFSLKLYDVFPSSYTMLWG